MPILSDEDLAAPYCAPRVPCPHFETEFKVHTQEEVCRCGARRRVYGPDQTWKRLESAIDQRRTHA